MRCNKGIMRFVVSYLAAALFSLTLLSNLKTASSSSILDVVKSSSDHTLLASFLEESNLASYLASSSNTATLFAPTDNDFAALPTPYSFYLHKQWYLHLHYLLSFHVVPQALTESQIFAIAKNTSLVTLTENNDTISVFASNMSINGGATIVTADIQASNGYVQVPSRVLVPGSLTHRVTDYFRYLDQSKYYYILDIFKFAASNSGIGTALFDDSEPGVTMLIPPNSGFSGISSGQLETYMTSTASAYEIAGYQAVAMLIYPSLFFHRPMAIEMMNGYTAWLYSDADNITRINDAVVSETLLAENGAVTEIDTLLRPVTTGDFLNLTTRVGAFPLTTFLNTFISANLTDYFHASEIHPLTYFVPVDGAFTSVQTLVTRLQQPVWSRHLRSLLLHHVTEGAVKTTDLPSTTRSLDLHMLSSYTITVAVAADANITVNGVQALISDLACTNGVVNVIDEVLVPLSVSESLYKQVSALNTLSSLIRIVGLVDALDTSEGPLTLLAPNDAAFAKVGNLANFSNDEIKQVLMNHVFAANIYVSDLDMSKTTPNLISNSWSVTQSGNNTYVDGALILSGDNLASNGVFHVINTVLVGSVKATGATPAAAVQGSFSGVSTVFSSPSLALILSLAALALSCYIR